MTRLGFIASFVVSLMGLSLACTDRSPTAASPGPAPASTAPSATSSPTATALATLDRASAETAVFDCSQLDEVHVRFSEPGYLDHLGVGLYVSYVGVPEGPKRLRLWWNYENEFDRYQDVPIDDSELERISGKNVYGKVIEHRYEPVSVETPRQVRAELMIDGMSGGCGRNRDIVVSPAGPVVEVESAGGSSSSLPCQGKPCVVFVTSTRHDGNLGGVAGGDEICRGLALDAGLPGDFKAWLSDDHQSPATRFTHSSRPYELVDGTVIAMSWSALTRGAVTHHIDRTERGIRADGIKTVWTRTRPDGTTADFGLGPDCQGWTRAQATEYGTNGEYDGNPAFWSFLGASSCNARLRLYCFQQ